MNKHKTSSQNTTTHTSRVGDMAIRGENTPESSSSESEEKYDDPPKSLILLEVEGALRPGPAAPGTRSCASPLNLSCVSWGWVVKVVIM